MADVSFGPRFPATAASAGVNVSMPFACANCGEDSAEVNRLQALVSEQAREIERLVEAGNAMHEGGKALRTYIVRDKTKRLKGDAWGDNLEAGLAASTLLMDGMQAWRAALAARGGEGQG